jgi:hypothetical protein
MRVSRAVFALLLLAPTVLQAQSIYGVVRAAKGVRPIRIYRLTETTPRYFNMAYTAMWTQSKRISISHDADRVILKALITQPQAHPIDVSGSYNYLRAVSQASKGLPEWKKINSSDGYNGVHHIINKTVLEELYRVRTKTDNGLTYNDFVRNSPGAFHPLHNDQSFTWLFHNPTLQMRIYAEQGVQGVLLDYFQKANAISREYGFPEYTDEHIRNTLVEARFWAGIWGLEWGE